MHSRLQLPLLLVQWLKYDFFEDSDFTPIPPAVEPNVIGEMSLLICFASYWNYGLRSP
ncbi:hypothetical protein [Acaryochloris marina]|uniref:hypothetical protein n=1 Tax=Acaryochloris marina TaxID=155978 RepID=UPI00164F5006|nr:hypothetical protein [Acaryochloris marina]